MINTIKRNLNNLGILIVFFLMIAYFSISNENFLSFENIINVLRQVFPTGIIAVGVSMVIITGNIDLSTGSMVGLTAVSAAWMMASGFNQIVAFALALLIGALCGIINGFFVSHVGIPAFVVTLSTQMAFRGLAYILTGGLAIYGFPEDFRWMGIGYLGIIPIPVIIMAVIFIIGYLLLAKTKFGRYVYGIGGNEEASRLSGVSPKFVKYMVYIFTGLLSALVGFMVLARVNSGNPNLGLNYEVDVIAACVVGGVSITGGKGSIPGVIIGVLFLGVLANGLILLNVNEFVQLLIKGGVIVLATSFDLISQRQKEKSSSSAV